MDIIKTLQEISMIGKKKAARKIIYSIEESARTAGIPLTDVLKNVYTELEGEILIDAIIKLVAKPNQTIRTGIALYLERAIAQLTKGRPRSVAYKDILTPDAINILKAAENRGTTGSDIFKNQSKTEAIVSRSEAKLRNTLTVPTISYAVAAGFAFFIINLFVMNISSMPKVDMSKIIFMRNYFVFITGVPIIAIYYIIIKYPDRVPKWKDIYKYVKSTNYLLLAKTMFENGMSSMDVLAFFKQLRDKNMRFDQAGNKTDIRALTTVLSYYLNNEERALMKASVNASDEKRVISCIAEERVSEIEETVDKMTGAFNKLLSLLAAWPVVLALNTLLHVMDALSSIKAK